MIEKPMLIGNHHDSSARDVIEECAGCSEEIYFGESCLDFGGDYPHAECITQYVKSHSTEKVAGE
ncbi:MULTISPECIES: hypothetical protein [Bacillus cereus group]|uniref:hypothetical protein n=1 Tax=Bacillus cereus group TaxID=86661 RepID=UPI0006A8E904|nr:MULTISPECIES: hypothetical protein [Bacillus cereus group]OPD56300.1 hypothetical protein BVG01_25165 [Bacillus anthracis]CUB39457.1 hypothetical protein BN2127_JRS4_03192 [Bacillus cereus]